MKEVFPEKFSLKQTHFHKTFCIFVKCYILTAECFLEEFRGFFPNNCHDKALMDARCGFDNLDNREMKSHLNLNILKKCSLQLMSPNAACPVPQIQIKDLTAITHPLLTQTRNLNLSNLASGL